MWVKSFVAPEEAACNLRNLVLQWCDPVIQFWHLKKENNLIHWLHCYTAPHDLTGGTAPLVRIRMLSENVQKYRRNKGSDTDLCPYEYLTLSINERECNAKPLDCFSKPGAHIAHDATETLEAIYRITRSFLWSHKILDTTFIP